MESKLEDNQEAYTRDKKIDMFREWLQSKGLKDRTINEYLRYFSHYRFKDLNQRAVNRFINQNHNIVARAFIKNLREFIIENRKEFGLDPETIEDIRDFKIPKLTGRKERRLPKPISEEEVIKIGIALKRERDKCMLLLSYFCGLRLQELLNIKTYDFNWKLFDEQGRKQFGELTVFGKGSKEALAIVPPDVMMRVRNYINKELIPKGITPSDRIFKVSQRYWQKMLTKTAEATIARKVNPHLLRHSVASNALKEGVDLMFIKEFLRHSSITSTEVYLHLDKQELKEKFAGVLG